MSETTSALEAARIEVMKAVGYAQKTGNNTQQKYRYASEVDFLKAVRPEMVANGLTLCPSGVESVSITERRAKNSSGNETVNYITTALVHFDLKHVSGERQPICVLAQGSDAMEKGAYKAMTGALKYALRQLFLIETGDEPEKEVEPPGISEEGMTTLAEKFGMMQTLPELKAAWDSYGLNERQYATAEQDAEVVEFKDKRKAEIEGATNA